MIVVFFGCYLFLSFLGANLWKKQQKTNKINGEFQKQTTNYTDFTNWASAFFFYQCYKCFKKQNSWDTNQLYEGYFYCSEAFFRAKTLNILVHKDAIPAKIAKKMGIKK